jgi:hypothetical protein
VTLSTLPQSRAHSPDWRFWLTWIVASTAAILLAFGMLYALVFLAKAVVPGVNEDRLLGPLIFPVLATVLGASQWLVLRRRIPRSGWWVLATGAGMLIGIALGVAVLQAIGRSTGQPRWWEYWPDLLLLYAVVGLSLALAQLPVLWRHITNPALWLLAGTVGWIALGLIMGPTIDRTSDTLALGAVPAAFTGLALSWLIRAPRTVR